MHEAAQLMLGRHDFSAFRAAECQANSPVRTLDRLSRG
jgi:tRNA pseudouridine38-40 synthase